MDFRIIFLVFMFHNINNILFNNIIDPKNVVVDSKDET
jgi:hypothetical protein